MGYKIALAENTGQQERLTPNLGGYVPRQSENGGLRSKLERQNAGLRSGFVGRVSNLRFLNLSYGALY